VSDEEKRDSNGIHWGAINWAGDVRTLTFDELLVRMNSISGYVCAKLKPPTVVGRRATPDAREAERALGLWEAARDEFLTRDPRAS
jgi:hypothetical protein